MTKPTDRDRAMAREALTDSGKHPRFCARMLDEAMLAELIAKARAEERETHKLRNNSREYVWQDDLFYVPIRAQTQRALNDQLRDLIRVAVRLGLYDAADFIRGFLKEM